MMPDQEKFEGGFQKKFRFFYGRKKIEGWTYTDTRGWGGFGLPPWGWGGVAAGRVRHASSTAPGGSGCAPAGAAVSAHVEERLRP